MHIKILSSLRTEFYRRDKKFTKPPRRDTCVYASYTCLLLCADNSQDSREQKLFSKNALRIYYTLGTAEPTAALRICTYSGAGINDINTLDQENIFLRWSTQEVLIIKN